MKIGIRAGDNSKFLKRVKRLAKSLTGESGIEKARTHKYVKREGSPGHYKYYYRLPDGRLGSKAELKAALRGKKPDPQKPDSQKLEAERAEKLKRIKTDFKAGKIDHDTAVDHAAKIYEEYDPKIAAGNKKKRGKKLGEEARQKTSPEQIKGRTQRPNQKLGIRKPGMVFDGGKNHGKFKPGDKVMARRGGEASVEATVKKIVTRRGRDTGMVVVEDSSGRQFETYISALANPKAGQVRWGDKITGADINGVEVSGMVTSIGRDGVVVDGHHKIEHGNYQVSGSALQGSGKDKQEESAGQEKSPEKDKVEKEANKTFIPPDKFTAADWSKQHFDPKATPDETGKEHILKSYGKDGETIANAIRDTDSKNQRLINDKQLTHQLYRLSGEGVSARYTAEREKRHGEIMQELLHPDKIRTALPPRGEKPKFMILGGRGGSGKSWFENNLYDPNKCIVLDSDEIKKRLPEYKGWNANQVHEESTDICEQMLAFCIRNGLNVVYDATMKTTKKALAKVLMFESAGYKTEAHYMFCPPQEAAKRAIGRFKGKPKKGKEDEFVPYNGRYVPVTAVLENTTNEASFDQVKEYVDNWSFRDNFSKREQNDPPIIISEGGKKFKKSFSALVKKIIQAYN